MSRLAGKVAIVTGDAGGIGAATARELAREGAAVAVVDIDLGKAVEIAEEIREAGARAITHGGDLADEDVAPSVVESTVAEFGRVDILHNNAALTDQQLSIPGYHGVRDVARCVAAVIGTSISRSQLLMCKHTVPEMRRNGGGSIINMSSGAALSGDRTRTGLRRVEGRGAPR